MSRAARKRLAELHRQLVASWHHPVGTEVIVRKDDGTEVRTRTRSTAQLLGGHTAVIWLEGISGRYALERVRPAPRESACA